MSCDDYDLPKLYAAGWNDEQISEQKSFTDGRIVVAGSKVRRRPQKRLDYLPDAQIGHGGGICKGTLSSLALGWTIASPNSGR